ncbi:hypothetical protein [Paenibacillus mucilaginosus]|uniref:Uncharacterized protein n=2 Tax=Paenibacillus mucilaginosus TaxID=61624 RepID=H6NIM9_9BACL|nr:hypothetical protein [Paenibacillus mucilaginosus]AEI45376.1 hypothetical protein KNP414_06858 [Paenibacillus mucilaginosus KNP414]AFC33096.1 hypothetical protein PM3016_6470 [Paenibacillus mucilaginosus 3016]MCG7218063.1 hypothetical protein [Paenibacillus mucilaginosus]WDM26822.1 hypothetical protein KCX80_31130 [Paenibacillus mucilaginosus]WFA21531.1 hypothetical protein ERY13_32130 [Paenibacillus mucilaginosus]
MNIEHLIKKVSKYVTFGQPVSSGSVVSQRLSDPRIPILAYYLINKQQNQEEQHYHEIWLKKDGNFAITESWYRESNVTRKLLKDHLSFEALQKDISAEDAEAIVIRLTEVIKKSEMDDWRPLSSRRG